jgi:hypothetical protein
VSLVLYSKPCTQERESIPQLSRIKTQTRETKDNEREYKKYKGRSHITVAIYTVSFNVPIIRIILSMVSYIVTNYPKTKVL